MKRMILIVLAAVFLPVLAEAMTLKDVIDLNKSGVGDDVITSQIEASGDVFTLTVQDILDLKEAGVSDRVITYMINTGKSDEGVTDEKSVAEDSDDSDRYHSNVDSYYRDYNDPYWNVYLSWGYGRYYDPWYIGYWPSYAYYYQPYYWCGSYRPFYYHSYYHGHGSHGGYYGGGSGHATRSYKDGRTVYGRGGASEGTKRISKGTNRSYKGTDRSYKGTDRSYKGTPGGSRAVKPGTAPGVGRTTKPPVYGGRGGSQVAPPPPSSGRAAPAPSTGSGRTGKSNPPSTESSQSGRTKKS